MCVVIVLVLVLIVRGIELFYFELFVLSVCVVDENVYVELRCVGKMF